MQRCLPIFFFILFAVVLAGCDSFSKPEYSYIQPTSDMEKKCASSCSAGKNSCEKICYLKNQACYERAHQEAQYAFLQYKNAAERRGERVTKTIRDFTFNQRCAKNCHCITSYNTCFSACGGQVIERHY